MIIKPSRSGQNPLDYPLGNHDWTGRERSTPPEISRGSAERFRLALDPAVGCATIICSFEESLEELSGKKMEEFMERTEEFLLPGVRKQAWQVLWIRHVRGNGSVDYHLLVCLKLLSSGKSIALLSARRGDLRHLFAYQEWANCHFGFSSPMEGHRRRIAEITPHRLPRKNRVLFRAVDEAVSGAFDDGLINDRADIVEEIRRCGFVVERDDKRSLTVADRAGTKAKLKGLKYQAEFTRSDYYLNCAKWICILARPQAEKERYFSTLCEAARAERTKLLAHSIRAADRPGPFFPSESPAVPGAGESAEKRPRRKILTRGLPASLFIRRTEGHPGVPQLAPAIASLRRDLPRILPSSAAQLPHWTTISTLESEDHHEDQNATPQPDSRFGQAAPAILGKDPTVGAESGGPIPTAPQLPANDRREQPDHVGADRENGATGHPAASARRFAFDSRQLVHAAEALNEAANELNEAVRELNRAVQELEEWEAREASRKRVLEFIRNGPRYDQPSNESIEPSL